MKHGEEDGNLLVQPSNDLNVEEEASIEKLANLELELAEFKKKQHKHAKLKGDSKPKKKKYHCTIMGDESLGDNVSTGMEKP